MIQLLSVSSAFQATVLQLLVKMRGDIKDVSDRVDHATSLLMTLTGDMHEQEDELTLPNDVQWPLQSLSDMDVLEEMLKDAQFRKRLVCKINGVTSWSFMCRYYL